MGGVGRRQERPPLGIRRWVPYAGKREMSLTTLGLLIVGALLFITHQIPRGLMVDEVIELGTNTIRQMEVVEEEN